MAENHSGRTGQDNARGTLPGQYRKMTGTGRLQFDPAQERVAIALQQLLDRLDGYTPAARAGFFRSLFGRGQKAPAGLYIHGGVGSGKTMLMDMFYAALPAPHRQRKHFSAFMEDVHHAITCFRKKDAARGSDDPVTAVANQITGQTDILCLDEFQVTDITDAMILGRLFETLFQRGMVLVTTGNTPLHELYKNGINRELFLPFIDLIELHTHVMALETGQDYRRLASRGHNVWHLLQDSRNRTEETLDYEAQWQHMTAGQTVTRHDLSVNGRSLAVPRAAGGTARLTFDGLCSQPLGRADYLAIADNYDTLFIDTIPVMDRDMRNESRRFTLLVDSLYDRGRILIATAHARPDALFAGATADNSSRETGRTASRLNEMLSKSYLEKHPALKNLPSPT